jgi:hypothetical protein
MEKILEEQIERMRQLTERMTQIRREVVQNTAFIAQQRQAAPAGPLHDYRDYRTIQSHDYPEHHASSKEDPRRSSARSHSPKRRRS